MEASMAITIALCLTVLTVADSEPGFFYSADVLEGVPDLARDRVRYMRVFQQEYTTFSDRMQTTRWSGPCVSVVQEDGVKRILGTVPVSADGSVYFPVPAGKMLYFQLLDERHRALQTMRSFTGAMPGETRGCAGCHKMHHRTPPARPLSALAQPPVELTPPPWGDETIRYVRFVQPVLDRYCVDCHRGDAAEKVDDMSLQRLIAGVDAMGPYRALEEIRGIADPDFEGIEELAIRPRTRTAPMVRRP
jgi:hypothetical protein